MNDGMMQSILGVVRHALTTFGGYVVASGFASQSDVELAIGAIVTLLGVAWSVFHKFNQKEQA